MLYRFKNQKRIKSEIEAMALLRQLGKLGVAGCLKLEENDIVIGFLHEPSKEELEFLKRFLKAEEVNPFEEVDSDG